MKTKVDAATKSLKADFASKSKKADATVKKAKKTEEDAKKEAADWKSKYENEKATSKANYEREVENFKKTTKAQMDSVMKVQIEAAVFKKVRAAVAEEQAKWEKRLRDAKQDHKDEMADKMRKAKMELDAVKEAAREKASMAAEKVPPSAANELLNCKNKLASATRMAQKMMTAKNKCTSECKEKTSDLETRRAKLEMKEQDCQAREREAMAAKTSAEEKQSIATVKMNEGERKISRLERDLQAQKRDFATLQEAVKSKAEDASSVTAKYDVCKKNFVQTKSKLNDLTSKLSAGEGALMAEIETLKTAKDQETERLGVSKNQIRKCHNDMSKDKRDLTANIVKLRECGQEVFNTKREVDKYKSRFDTLQMAHTSTTEQYRNTHSKLELCGDRMRDAKIKEKGCEEAMRRMKTYNSDQINEQKMQIARLRAEVTQAKDEARKMTVSQEDKSRADALAKKATEKAVADAVAQAQATGLAVKAQAQEAVDKAAKEAVKLANEQALAGAANSN